MSNSAHCLDDVVIIKAVLQIITRIARKVPESKIDALMGVHQAWLGINMCGAPLALR